MAKPIIIADYGMCNLLSVERAFERCGATVRVTESAVEAAGAERLVVPGVGAFGDCVREVESRGFGEAIRKVVETGRPLLGICVGMQMLFDGSEEFGEHIGLGILPGMVRRVPHTTVAGAPQRVPHVGWSEVVPPESGRAWRGTLLEPLNGTHASMYFVHSFAAEPTDQAHRLADCFYGGHRLCAAVQRDNTMATQFHPERSGETGLRIVSRFLAL